jgi:AraC-like DNA-binding protein
MRVVLRDVVPGMDGVVRLITSADIAFAEAHFHSHDELELNLVLSGWARYLLEGGRYDLAAGNLLWLFPGQEHMLFESSADFSMWVAVFAPRLVRRQAAVLGAPELTDDDPPGQHCRALAPPDTEELNTLLASLAEGDQPADSRRSGMHWLLARAWTLYQRARADRPTDVDPAIARAAELVQENERSWPLRELARELGLSPSWISRRFHRQLGLTLVEYRNRQRLARFLERARSARAPNLLRLALDAGFTSYPQFTRVFRRALGAGPRAWLRAARPRPARRA